MNLDALLGIRFVAAISVVLAHLDYLPFSTAVPFFYVLSGFILTCKYAGDPGLARDPRKFWIARASRIYPVYILGLGLFIFYRWLTGYDFTASLAGLAASSLMLQSWFPRLSVGWNTPGWSCSDEAFFYLLFPAMAVVVVKIQERSSLIALIAACWVAGMLPVAAFFWHSPAVVSIEWWIKFLQYSPLIHVPEFVIGMALGRLWATRPPDPPVPPSGSWLSAICSVVVMVVTVYPVPRLVIHGVFLAPVFALLIWGLARGGGLARPLSTPVAVRLGYASYAFYILQDPVKGLYFYAFGDPWAATHRLSEDLSYMIVLALLSVVTYEWFEEPSMVWLRNKLNRALWPLNVGRDSLVAAVLLLIVLVNLWLLPQRNRVVTPKLSKTIAALGPSAVAWHHAGDRRYLVGYQETLPNTAIVSIPTNAPYTLAPRGWEGARQKDVQFIASEDDTDLVLWAMPGTSMAIPLGPRHGVTLGLRPNPAVPESGLHGLEGEAQGQPFRWTDGHATLELTVPSNTRHLAVVLGHSRGQTVEIRVDGQPLWSQIVGDQPNFLINLTNPPGAFMKVEILSPTFVPRDVEPGSNDSRKLGVVFRGLRLLP